jgi:hypothetical protein
MARVSYAKGKRLLQMRTSKMRPCSEKELGTKTTALVNLMCYTPMAIMLQPLMLRTLTNPTRKLTNL